MKNEGSVFVAAPSSVRMLKEGEESLWDDYVARNNAGSIYHLSAWRYLIERLFRHESHYVYAADEGDRVTGVLPLVRLRSLLFGDYLVSMPYFNYGGAIADSPRIEQLLMERAARIAADAGCSHIEFRDTVARPASWPVRTDKVGMELILPSDVNDLWSSLGSKLRSQIKRPQREAGIEVVHGGHDLLGEFYQVFARNMRDLGTPVYAVAMFREILQTFPKTASIVVVRFNNRPAAAAFLIGYKDRIEIPWAASVKELNRFGFNMLLYWEVLKKAVEQRYAIFDFGRSTRDGGTYKFKKQWGAQERPLYWHYWLAPGKAIPNLTPKNPKYNFAIGVWKKLPVFVTNRLGPWLVGNLP